MKDHRILSARQEVAAEDKLFNALIRLQSIDELRDFLHDLCTPAELQAMKDRWAAVELLATGTTYRAIHEQTGVSVTTVGRVARCLTDGAGGYRKALEQLKGTDE
ncbi:MAG: YerC/YecD family TrpR-related protein [Gammaproteobacteria bacterium]|jgi:TrpR-related protein YerC/YecD|nr:YerC/YecD family TrpR-related protein [Gammaproteobacteria bacterium]MDP7296232.1 YerC/YecD family TrpR-related protein [Gammaproteobacteria bacterium]MDP7418546.1 YerC/YecD family TrpR-related protein [Gammaproteobacteria bacterium]MDP7661315.1 YerC/YecD family TrpR-related protein [Gammaproteobacteria bacterium]HJP39925.1 YerC/YecD family TrpR-related protein [Gammaproteobacteria bacterium]